MPKDNIVSDNLPIYFIWFGSDVPPKYFDNLKRAAETNKSRDIILVYSEKHLTKGNRENIDSIESMSIDDIKAGIDKKRDNDTQNLCKIDVYDMELDKQDERIYNLLGQAFTTSLFSDKKSFRYCVASDIIRLPLLNITGGIYFDVDTEITGEIGNIESKKGFNYNNYYDHNNQHNITGNFLIKVNKRDDYFYELMQKYFDKVKNIITSKPNCGGYTDPVSYLNYYINKRYIIDCIKCFISKKVSEDVCYTLDFGTDKDGNDIKFRFYNIRIGDKILGSKFQGKIDSQTAKFEIYDQIISDYGIKVPSTVKLKIEQGKGYDKDYNNPRDLKKLGLDQQSDISSKLNNILLGLQSIGKGIR